MSNQKFSTVLFLTSFFLAGGPSHCRAAENLVNNPGFEQDTREAELPVGWALTPDSGGHPRLDGREARSGHACLTLPPHSAVSQNIRGIEPGAYLFRCWVNSESEQAITVVLQDPDHPAASYTYADLKVPKGRWTQVETFCAVEQPGSLTLTIGGMSSEYRKYHGGTSEMRHPVRIDDCELIRSRPKAAPALQVWDAGKALDGGTPDLHAAGSWSAVSEDTHEFTGRPILQARQVVGAVRAQDGALALFSAADQTLKPRGVVLPQPAFTNSKTSLVRVKDKAGLRVTSRSDGRSYTALFSASGIVEIEPQGVPQFRIDQCELRYGLLPSLVGADICYAPEKLTSADEVKLPSTQWFVGLRKGNDSMLVVVWPSTNQSASLRMSGGGKERMIDALTLGTETNGFSLSLVEHPNIWTQQALSDDWLGDYSPLDWQRPFPARWMAHFFVTASGKPSFRAPHMGYSFPIANAKTRMWGVWFEDWNHYPFFFDGARLIAHFEKSFVPNGDALVYFLEPAAADLYSPCEIVEQVLGQERAAALFDFDANQIRRLRYSTPSEFMYDRPVCATTTHLSTVKREEKPTVGVNLATHLYEFIREIRGRVDQYVAFFDQMKAYLEAEGQAHPECHAYLAELQALVTDAKAKSQEIYATPLSTVQTKTDGMKKLLQEGKGDGFDCGALDVRGPAGAQDDLCRRYNRLVVRLSETAALKCGNSAEQAAVATHVWQECRRILRQPTRWEPRRTLYFFEP